MAEAITFNVVADILFKMGNAGFLQICSVYGVCDDMRKFKRTLITVNAALQDADKRQEESNLIKDWINTLNKVVYDADDVLDAFTTKNLQRQLNMDGRAKRQVSEFFSSSNPLVFRYKLSRKIKKIRERLDETKRTMSMFKFAITERVIDRTRVGGSHRETTSYVAESHVIGREKEKEEIINMLMCSSNEEKVSIVSIVGIGGLGKTTLAQSVYRDKKVDDNFQLKIWVCVSEDFEKKSLVKRILKSITNNEVGDLDMEQLQRKLRENIDGKRYLLILDDIWNEDHEMWIDVKTYLEGGAQGSKILVTTRSTKVTSAMDVENPYILKGLTEEHSWTLFEKFAFRGQKEVHVYMESVGKEIIKRCKGVPLAIRSLGSVMQSKTRESEWEAIRNSDIWSSLENNNSILPILKLSYDLLPIHLRQCFVYCSIFPKDHTLKKDLLVQLWMAQGYIQSSGESQDLEDIGDQYFEDLISRSFFQDVEVISDNVRCKMHDLIHDLAVKVGGPHYCSIAENSSVNISERVNHVSFGFLENVPTQLIQAKGLRTYFSSEDFDYTSEQQARPNELLLSKFRRLRVLDLQHCGIEKLSKLVGKMQHLRLLDLSMNEKMEVLPNSITNLVNLQMLNLSYCSSLKELPEGSELLLCQNNMAEGIAFDVATNILTKLGDAAFRRICLVYGVDDDLENLKETLSTINAACLDADRRQEESHLIKDWIRKLNDVVYDADDVLDAFNTKNLQRQLKIDGRAKIQVSCEFFSYSNPLVFRYKMGRKIKKIRERLDGIASTMSKYNFANTERVIDQPRVGDSYRESVSYVSESHVIGREKEKKEIIDMLMRSSNEEKVSIVSIVGIGGLGKTTLAQSVYCDKRVDDHFQLMIWVCVSEDFEKKSLVRRILKSITKNEVGDLDMDQLQSKLRENIDGKRYLLILDDIWNEDPLKWIDVKPFLEGGAQGSKILVTTRSIKVTLAMDVENTYILKGLTEEQSWTLFENVAFRGQKEVHAYMKSIGEEIIIRCKGVPLAIKSLGSVMKLKTTKDQWLAIRNSDIWSSLENNISILPILKLSYDHLPIHLRQCFVYCSIFPKDHTLEKDLLVQLWMAQGYIQSSGESQNLEDIGDQYFEDLISRSFLQDVEVTSDNVRCKMHDLIHDLALKIAGPRYCSIVENSSVNISERVNHVSFGLLENVPTQLIQAKGLRTYFSTEDFDSWSMEQARPNKLLLSKIRRLRALDLRKCGFEKLSNLVGKMQHLRFLDLSWNEEMKVLPNSITNLVNLQMLNLSSCKGLKELPEGISKLISLRHLIIDKCYKITGMPRGLGKLTSLRTLSKFVVGDDKRSAKLGELHGLNNLRGDLRIENLENVRNSGEESKEANLMGKPHLKSLTLSWGKDFEELRVVTDADKEDAEILLEGLQPHPNIKELRIEGYCGGEKPSWIMGFISLPNIVYIRLSMCPNIRHLPPFHQLPCLKTLTLEWLSEVECDDDGSSSSSSFSPSFPCLTHLYIFHCPKLTSMPLAPLLETLDLTLVSQKLLCQLLTTTIPSSSPLSRLTSLSISEMEDIESLTFFPEGVPQNLTSLKKLEIRDCPRLLHLAVSGEIQHLTALEDLTIWNCEELDLTHDGMNWQGLRSLREIEIWGIPKLVSLPEGLQHITTLEDLTIRGCKELDLTRDGMNWQGLRSLRRIHIVNIPKLVSLPEGLQHITTLQRVWIGGCPGLVDLPEWTSNIPDFEINRFS